MFTSERHDRIVDLLNQRGRLSVTELQALLQTSVATIRRDLATLEEAGRAVRTHGGVVRPTRSGAEASFALKARTRLEAKQAIAARAVELVPANATVFIDAGTTTLEAGRRLLGRTDLTLFTNSLPLLNLRIAGQARIVSVGGELREISRAMVGGIAMDWLRHLRFDCALLAASGLDLADGASTTELTEAQVKREFAARARRTLLLADANKWNQPAPIVFAAWGGIHDFVTDYQPTRAEAAHLTAHGVMVHAVRPA